MMKKIIFTILLIAVVLTIIFLNKYKDEAEIMSLREGPMAGEYSFNEIQGILEDVTEGEIRGINTDGLSAGIAMAGFWNEQDQYQISAEFQNLPDPVGDDFYEGWIVRRGINFSVISTGELIKETDGVWTNIYSAEEDLLDHSFYVLTLEPNDGDPAPADHILEGVMR